MKKRILALMLTAIMLLSVLPITASANEQTEITEIVVTFDFVQPSYGDTVTKSTFDITVQGDIPVTVTNSGFDWYIWDDSLAVPDWDDIDYGYFTDGTWCYDLKVDLNDTTNYAFADDGADLIVNGVNWGKVRSSNWYKSPSFEIAYESGHTLYVFNHSSDSVPTSYIGEAIDEYSFAKCVVGGTKPYTFSKVGGPDWLVLSEDGILSGTPTATSSATQFYLVVTDAEGNDASMTFSVGATYIDPADREVVSRVEGTVEIPELYCGDPASICKSFVVSTTVGAPAYISSNSSDFYTVNGSGGYDGYYGTLVAGTYSIDVYVGIRSDFGHTHVLDKDNLEVIINGQPVNFRTTVTVYNDSSYLYICVDDVVVNHKFDNDTDATCNGCGYTREGCDHQYDSVCAAECNICGAERVVSADAHTYQDECDTSCDECGITRVAPHTYSGVCDAICNLCGYVRDDVEPHTYSDCTDKYCDICSYKRVYFHSFDDCNDAECNECDFTRPTPTHTYASGLDTTCELCDATRELNYILLGETKTVDISTAGTVVDYIFVPTVTGSYFFSANGNVDSYGIILDANENELTYNDDNDGRNFGMHYEMTAGESYILRARLYSTTITGTFTVSVVCTEHTYDDDCDEICNICGITREVPHDYDDDCDEDCNICGSTREASHYYEDDCDELCDDCGATRIGDHEYYYDCDVDCNICGKIRTDAASHTFTGCTDRYCDVCQAERYDLHVFDDCNDAECNECDFTRPTPTHTYANGLDTTCELCDATRVLNYITAGEIKSVEIDVAGEYVEFIFIPTVSTSYYFSSIGENNGDTYGYIFDANGKKLQYNDDNDSYRNFGIHYEMTAGETYILRARLYNATQTRTFNVSVVCTEHTYDNDSDTTCNVCGFVREIEEEIIFDVVGDIDYTVSGNQLTVDSSIACKVIWGDSTSMYVLTGTDNGDGTYTYTIPEGAIAIGIAYTGDVNLDGTVTMTDYIMSKRAVMGTYELEYAKSIIGDINGDDSITATDYILLKRAVMGTYVIR